jgi:thiamine kinase-like enzyme
MQGGYPNLDGDGAPGTRPVEAARSRVAALAIWTGPVTPEPLGGGITNHNFVVADAGRRVVVRVGEDIAVHNIVRATELAASRAAHAAGVAPAVLHAEPGVLVFDWLEARPLTAEDVADPANLDRLAALLRRCHREIPRHFRGPAPFFWVFQVVRDYAHRLRDEGSRYAGDLPRLVAAAEVLEAAVGPVEIVFGHNDLVPGNILDDGDRLWLVDWEYAGFDTPLFDLGGLASNAEMPEALRTDLLAAYYGRAPDAGLLRGFAAMTAASLLRETLWSMVSERHSTIDFDYAGYTSENRRRFEAAWEAFGG